MFDLVDMFLINNHGELSEEMEVRDAKLDIRKWSWISGHLFTQADT